MKFVLGRRVEREKINKIWAMFLNEPGSAEKARVNVDLFRVNDSGAISQKPTLTVEVGLTPAEALDETKYFFSVEEVEMTFSPSFIEKVQKAFESEGTMYFNADGEMTVRSKNETAITWPFTLRELELLREDCFLRGKTIVIKLSQATPSFPAFIVVEGTLTDMIFKISSVRN